MQPSVIYNIKSKQETFSPKELEVARFITDNREFCISATINDLSKEAGISNATMVRFVRKIGFDSYQSFRIALAKETEPVDLEGLRQGTDTISMAFDITRRYMDIAQRHIDPQTVSEAGSLLSKARTIYAFGTGGSAIIAYDFYHRFISTGLSCQFNTEYHTQLIQAAQSRKEDAAVVFCYTGIDKDTIDIARLLKAKQCKTVVVTQNGQSPINQYADYGIYLSGLANPVMATDTYPERIVLSIVIDILYLEVLANLKEKSIIPVKNVEDAVNSRML